MTVKPRHCLGLRIELFRSGTEAVLRTNVRISMYLCISRLSKRQGIRQIFLNRNSAFFQHIKSQICNTKAAAPQHLTYNITFSQNSLWRQTPYRKICHDTLFSTVRATLCPTFLKTVFAQPLVFPLNHTAPPRSLCEQYSKLILLIGSQFADFWHNFNLSAISNVQRVFFTLMVKRSCKPA